jgi:D-methionine transport system ATP-binding protein
MIRLDHVSKRFAGKNGAVEALKDVSIHVEQGDIYGIIGFSGAGKSTLIRMVNRLETPDTGSVTVDGQALAALSKAELRMVRRKIGMVFQQFNLLDSKTVFQNVAVPLILGGAPKEKIRARVEEVLRFVELEEKRDTFVSQLSGGQKQRVGIARALATGPSILLCDEATSALDPKTTESILALLKRTNREMGVTVLLITHQMQVIQRVCNKVAVMENGKIVEQGSVLDVFGRPRETATREFVRTVINDQIPESILGMVQAERRHYRIERLKFVGDSVKKPVIAEISKTEGLEVNVLCATVQELQDSVICLFVLQLIGPEELIEAAEARIDALGILREGVETV